MFSGKNSFALIMTHFRKWKKYGLPCRWRIPLRWQTNKNLDMVLGRQTGRIFTLWKSLRSQSITIRGILLHKQDEHQLKGNFLKQSHVEQIENPQSFKKDLFFFHYLICKKLFHSLLPLQMLQISETGRDFWTEMKN